MQDILWGIGGMVFILFLAFLLSTNRRAISRPEPWLIIAYAPGQDDYRGGPGRFPARRWMFQYVSQLIYSSFLVPYSEDPHPRL